jgi:hypothetical protein
MAKLTNVRERIHQPFYDTYVRTAGIGGANVTDRESLFTNRARQDDITAVTNLENGSTLPSDQSHVTLALRVFTWFRAPTVRNTADAGGGVITANGDFSNAGVLGFFGTGGPGFGNAPGDYRDVYRLHYQAMEQLHWSFGTGEKFSITNMATKYFPDGGGLSGDNGGVSDIIHWQNGTPDQTAILRLARAILLPPRQNVRCVGSASALPDGGNAALAGTVTTQGRNMLSLTSNINAQDGVNKVIQFTFDGLFARDVQ